jgi:triacylglycerol lipase
MYRAALLGAALSLATACTTMPTLHEPAYWNGERVVLLHGLARTGRSMEKMARALAAAGYRVCNVSYPSRKYSIAELVEKFLKPELERCKDKQNLPIHFVTHSMGGILLRLLVASDGAEGIGRVVMLSPPNGGSEVVDKLGGWGMFRMFNGPAGSELGTVPTALPLSLGPADFHLGIITGNRSINFFLSMLIPGPDDGKVSIERAKLEGMDDFLVIPATHPFIMKHPEAIRQTLHFLQYGEFEHANI